jgi:methylase of polypeptide subunit release factors/nucleoside diphosphate kinase
MKAVKKKIIIVAVAWGVFLSLACIHYGLLPKARVPGLCRAALRPPQAAYRVFTGTLARYTHTRASEFARLVLETCPGAAEEVKAFCDNGFPVFEDVRLYYDEECRMPQGTVAPAVAAAIMLADRGFQARLGYHKTTHTTFVVVKIAGEWFIVDIVGADFAEYRAAQGTGDYARCGITAFPYGLVNARETRAALASWREAEIVELTTQPIREGTRRIQVIGRRSGKKAEYFYLPGDLEDYVFYLSPSIRRQCWRPLPEEPPILLSPRDALRPAAQRNTIEIDVDDLLSTSRGQARLVRLAQRHTFAPQAIDRLLEHIRAEREPDAMARDAAIAALGYSGEERVVYPLARAYSGEPERFVQLTIISAFGTLATPEAVGYLRDIVRSLRNESGARALRELTAIARTQDKNVLLEERIIERPLLVECAATLKADYLVPELIDALASPLRREAAHALSMLLDLPFLLLYGKEPASLGQEEREGFAVVPYDRSSRSGPTFFPPPQGLRPYRVLDIGTVNGAFLPAVTSVLEEKFPGTHVIAEGIELSEEEQVRRGISEGRRIIRGNIQDYNPGYGYDVITVNNAPLSLHGMFARHALRLLTREDGAVIFVIFKNYEAHLVWILREIQNQGLSITAYAWPTLRYPHPKALYRDMEYGGYEHIRDVLFVARPRTPSRGALGVLAQDSQNMLPSDGKVLLMRALEIVAHDDESGYNQARAQRFLDMINGVDRVRENAAGRCALRPRAAGRTFPQEFEALLREWSPRSVSRALARDPEQFFAAAEQVIAQIQDATAVLRGLEARKFARSRERKDFSRYRALAQRKEEDTYLSSREQKELAALEESLGDPSAAQEALDAFEQEYTRADARAKEAIDDGVAVAAGMLFSFRGPLREEIDARAHALLGDIRTVLSAAAVSIETRAHVVDAQQRILALGTEEARDFFLTTLFLLGGEDTVIRACENHFSAQAQEVFIPFANKEGFFSSHIETARARNGVHAFDRAVASLLLLADTSFQCKMLCAAFLGNYRGDTHAARALARMLDDDDHALVEAALTALGRVAAAESADEIARVLYDQDASLPTKNRAVDALGAIASRAALTVLDALRQSETTPGPLRQRAASVLEARGFIPDRKSRELLAEHEELVRAVDSDEEDWDVPFRFGFGPATTVSIRALERWLLYNDDPLTRQECALSLGKLSPVGCEDVLTYALYTERDPDVRKDIVNALAQVRAPRQRVQGLLTDEYLWLVGHRPVGFFQVESLLSYFAEITSLRRAMRRLGVAIPALPKDLLVRYGIYTQEESTALAGAHAARDEREDRRRALYRSLRAAVQKTNTDAFDLDAVDPRANNRIAFVMIKSDGIVHAEQILLALEKRGFSIVRIGALCFLTQQDIAEGRHYHTAGDIYPGLALPVIVEGPDGAIEALREAIGPASGRYDGGAPASGTIRGEFGVSATHFSLVGPDGAREHKTLLQNKIHCADTAESCAGEIARYFGAAPTHTTTAPSARRHARDDAAVSGADTSALRPHAAVEEPIEEIDGTDLIARVYTRYPSNISVSLVPYLEEELLSGSETFIPVHATTIALLREFERGTFSLEGAHSACDVGCGVGTIGLYFAKRDIATVGLDISPDAVDYADTNANRLKLRAKFEAYESDLFDALPADRKFDRIAFNMPPQEGEPEHYHDYIAFAGPEYAILRRFFREAPLRLNKGGRIVISFILAGAEDLEERRKSEAMLQGWFREAGLRVTAHKKIISREMKSYCIGMYELASVDDGPSPGAASYPAVEGEKSALRPRLVRESPYLAQQRALLRAYGEAMRDPDIARIPCALLGEEFELRRHELTPDGFFVYQEGRRIGELYYRFEDDVLAIGDCVIGSPAVKQLVLFLVAQVAMLQGCEYVREHLYTTPAQRGSNQDERYQNEFAYFGGYTTALAGLEYYYGPTRSYKTLGHDAVRDIATQIAFNGHVGIRGKPDFSLFGIPVTAPLLQFMPPQFIRDYMAAHRLLIEPLLPDDAKGVYPFAGPDVATPFLLFDFDELWIVDRIPFEAPPGTMTINASRYAGLRRGDIARNSWFVLNALVSQVGSMKPLLLCELSLLGAHDIGIENLREGVYMIHFTCAYPGETARPRRIVYIQKTVTSADDLRAAGIYPRVGDFAMIKGSSGHPYSRDEILETLLAWLRPGGVIATEDGAMTQAVVNLGGAAARQIRLRVDMSRENPLVLMAPDGIAPNADLPYGYGGVLYLFQNAQQCGRSALRPAASRNKPGAPEVGTPAGEHFLVRLPYFERSILCTLQSLSPLDETTLGLLSRFREGFFSFAGAHDVCDMGCGVGPIGLYWAQEGMRVDGLDVNEEAIELANINAHRLSVYGRFQAFVSDLFAAVPPGTSYDRIVFNMPFKDKAPASMRDHVSNAGEDYEVVRRFIKQAPAYLREDGSIIVSWILGGKSAHSDFAAASLNKSAAEKEKILEAWLTEEGLKMKKRHIVTMNNGEAEFIVGEYEIVHEAMSVAPRSFYRTVRPAA